jgi:hypothetical protein
MKRDLQSKIWIVLIVAIISTAAVISVALIAIGAPVANSLADRYLAPGEPSGFQVHFEGSFDGADGEQGYDRGLSFVSGHTGQAALFNNEDTLSYLTDSNIYPQQGAVQFWLKPLWNGDDNQSYVFFEIGDSWFNRFRITKDGANNFRFMVWSSEVEYDVACNVSNWEANDWHQVRATWQSDSLSLYLDGVLCDTQTFVVMPASLSSQFFVGSSASQDMQAQSAIDEFAIYSQP